LGGRKHRGRTVLRHLAAATPDTTGGTKLATRPEEVNAIMASVATPAKARSVTVRPPRPAIARQGWRDLLLLHWAVPSACLRERVPRPLAVDEFQGTAFLSVVAFGVRAARPRWVPSFLGLDFIQTNVRTYVRLRGGEPAIHLLSANVTSRLAAATAELGLGVEHERAAILHRRRGDRIEHELERARDPHERLVIAGEIGEHRGVPLEGTLDHFLLERSVLHARRRGTIVSLAVRHPLWVPRTVHIDRIEHSLLELDLPGLEGPPTVAHYTKALDVEVLLPRVRLALAA
jgi:uncharacterized protein YqjF (DUF2071 family)